MIDGEYVRILLPGEVHRGGGIPPEGSVFSRKQPADPPYGMRWFFL
jgi:hypothetical protein